MKRTIQASDSNIGHRPNLTFRSDCWALHSPNPPYIRHRYRTSLFSPLQTPRDRIPQQHLALGLARVLMWSFALVQAAVTILECLTKVVLLVIVFFFEWLDTSTIESPEWEPR